MRHLTPCLHLHPHCTTHAHHTSPQTIVNGFQHEQPDYWLTFGNPWEIERLIVSYPIKFYGHVSTVTEEGKQVCCGCGCAVGVRGSSMLQL
jgi:hypothetical protein